MIIALVKQLDAGVDFPRPAWRASRRMLPPFLPDFATLREGVGRRIGGVRDASRGAFASTLAKRLAPKLSTDT